MRGTTAFAARDAYSEVKAELGRRLTRPADATRALETDTAEPGGWQA